MSENLTGAQRKFCLEYAIDFNATRAYRIAYPSIKATNTIYANSSRLLSKDKVKDFIKELQTDIEKSAGISRLRVANEYIKIAFSSIAHLHNNWIERKEFELLTEDQKAAIQEIETKILKKNIGTGRKPNIVNVEYVKIKLYDKKSALDSLSKMLGYNEPEKVDLSNKGEKFESNTIDYSKFSDATLREIANAIRPEKGKD